MNVWLNEQPAAAKNTRAPSAAALMDPMPIYCDPEVVLGATLTDLGRMLDRLRALEAEAANRSSEETLNGLEEARPVIECVVETLEQLREWETAHGYDVAHAYGEKSLVPHLDALFDEAEEAQVLALWFSRAFLARVSLLPTNARREELQEMRTLLASSRKALGEFIRRERELPLPS